MRQFRQSAEATSHGLASSTTPATQEHLNTDLTTMHLATTMPLRLRWETRRSEGRTRAIEVVGQPLSSEPRPRHRQEQRTAAEEGSCQVSEFPSMAHPLRSDKSGSGIGVKTTSMSRMRWMIYPITIAPAETPPVIAKARKRAVHWTLYRQNLWTRPRMSSDLASIGSGTALPLSSTGRLSE